MADEKKHTCQVSGCKNKVHAKGYCKNHYGHIWKYGKIMPARIFRTGCQVPGCMNKHNTKGYCDRHYYYIERYGKILPEKEKYIGCKIPGCDRKHYGNGYCHRHYQQLRLYGKILPKKEPKIQTACAAANCHQLATTSGYCRKHYTQILRHGKIMPDRKVYIGCKAPDCAGKHSTGGYCAKHYKQIRKHGSLKLENERRIPNKIIIKGHLAEIIAIGKPKNVQLKVLIDTEDIEKVKKYHWFYSDKAVRTYIKKKNVSLVRLITEIPEKKFIFHKNGNPLDCRKANLLEGTRLHISINSKMSSLNTSGHKGVTWLKRENLWMAYLTYHGKVYRGGYFKEKEEAITARKNLEAAYHNHLKLNIDYINEQ